MTTPMTTPTSIPTVGECASRALRDFVAIRAAQSAAPATLSWTATSGDLPTPRRREAAPASSPQIVSVTRTSIDLLMSCLRLAEKFPREARGPLVAALPFSGLEVQLLQSVPREADATLQFQIAQRIQEWITRSPVFVDESRVDVADFLMRLRPHLDSWDERAQVDELIDRLSES
jgi:hypothetical protein